MTGKDMANFESDKREPRIPNTEKAPQIQSDHQLSGHGGAGVFLDRAAEPSGAAQTQTKMSAPGPTPPPTTSPEVETANGVQTQPIREISFRLAGASANVDVQIAERAGKIQVAVRTPDQDLAKSLQTNLGELVGHLEQKGFRTDAWTPATEHLSGAVKEPSNSANSQSQSDHSRSPGGQQDQRHGQQQSNQRRQGHWKTQLDETLSAPIARTHEEENP
jgi:hypothetical protein